MSGIRLVSLLAVLMGLPFGGGGCVGENPDYCDETKPCPAGYTCHPTQHRCLPAADGAVDSTVDGQGPDPDGSVGDGASKQGNGASCTKAEQCTSDFCVDGSCCDGACGDVCKSCDLAGKAGICSSVPAGEDPRQDCGGDSCSAGTLDKKACDGQGACATTSSSCGDYACNAAKDACLTTCSENGHCASKLCDLHTTKNTCPAPTAVCYVDAKAGSGGSGTLAAPYATIAQCLATSKGYISVADGTYTENLVISGKKVQIVAQSEPGSVFDGAVPLVKLVPSSKTDSPLEVKSKAELVLRGFKVSSLDPNQGLVMSSGVLILMSVAVQGTGAAHCVDGLSGSQISISDAVINGCGGSGVTVTEGSLSMSHVLVTNSAGISYDGGNPPSAGASFSAYRVVSNNNTEGLSVTNVNKPSVDRVVAQDNTIDGIRLIEVVGATISNVLSTGNEFGLTWGSAACSGVCPGSILTNATIAFNSKEEVSCLGSNGKKLTITNSIVWDTLGKAIDGAMCSVVYSNVFSATSGATNINNDPLFVSPSTGNYKLSNTRSKKSPCIDAGDPAAKNLPKTDLDGAARMVNGVVDMGAYEAQ